MACRTLRARLLWLSFFDEIEKWVARRDVIPSCEKQMKTAVHDGVVSLAGTTHSVEEPAVFRYVLIWLCVSPRNWKSGSGDQRSAETSAAARAEAEQLQSELARLLLEAWLRHQAGSLFAPLANTKNARPISAEQINHVTSGPTSSSCYLRPKRTSRGRYDATCSPFLGRNGSNAAPTE